MLWKSVRVGKICVAPGRDVRTKRRAMGNSRAAKIGITYSEQVLEWRERGTKMGLEARPC